MNFPNLVVGRILFALPFLIFGLFHFTGADSMAGMVPSWLPGGVLWIYLTGIGLVAAPIAVLTGKKAALACQLLAVMLIAFVLTVHVPGFMAGGEGALLSLIGILKDTSMAGGALLMAHLSK